MTGWQVQALISKICDAPKPKVDRMRAIMVPK
jgi:hypothetical protein